MWFYLQFFLTLLHLTLSKDLVITADITQDVGKLLNLYNGDDLSFFQSTNDILPALFAIANTEFEIAKASLIENPELQRQLSAFDERIKEVSTSFKSTASLVDGQKTVLKLNKVMRAVHLMAARREVIFKEGGIDDPEQVRAFRDEFNDSLADALYSALRDSQGQGDQLFKVASELLHRHPSLTLKFMRGCVELLLHAFFLEMSRLRIIGSSQDSVHELERAAQEKLELVVKEVFKMDRFHETVVLQQIMKDQERLHNEWRQMKSCIFSFHVRKYLEEKYPRFACLVVTYDAANSFDKQAAWAPKGRVLQSQGRVSVVDCRYRELLQKEFKSIGLAMMERIRPPAQAKNGAKIFLEMIRNELEMKKLNDVAIVISSIYTYPLPCVAHTSKTNIIFTDKGRFFVMIFG